MLKTYNGFNDKQRMKGDRIIKKAVREGKVPPPTKCERCGQTEGRIDYHVEDYSPERILDNLEAVCGRCHYYIHREMPQEKKDAYWKDVAEGKIGKPWGKPGAWK